MKKLNYYIVTLLGLLCPLMTWAEETDLGVPKVWTVPAVFTCDEEVTFYYDMTDVQFPEGVDLYLWAWTPTEPDAGNGGNSSAFAKLTYLGNNIYCKKMIPTQYFHTNKEAFESDDWPGFWSRLKTKDGSKWSSVFQAPDSRSEFKAFKESGKGFMFYSGRKSKGFTEKFTLDEPLTVLFNPDVYKLGGRTLTELATDADFVQFGVHSGLNNWAIMQSLDVWRPACLQKVEVKKLSNGLYAWQVGVPVDYYSTNPGDGGAIINTDLSDPDKRAAFELDNMTYLVVKVIRDAAGANQWGVNSGDQLQKAGQAVPYPDPVFSLFPTRISQEDILTITREYNERTAGDPTYILTAGGKTITGVMEGVRDKRQATVNLQKELKGVTATQLQLVVKNVHGVTLVDTTIPLLTPDK